MSTVVLHKVTRVQMCEFTTCGFLVTSQLSDSYGFLAAPAHAHAPLRLAAQAHSTDALIAAIAHAYSYEILALNRADFDAFRPRVNFTGLPPQQAR